MELWIHLVVFNLMKVHDLLMVWWFWFVLVRFGVLLDVCVCVLDLILHERDLNWDPPAFGLVLMLQRGVCVCGGGVLCIEILGI